MDNLPPGYSMVRIDDLTEREESLHQQLVTKNRMAKRLLSDSRDAYDELWASVQLRLRDFRNPLEIRDGSIFMLVKDDMSGGSGDRPGIDRPT